MKERCSLPLNRFSNPKFSCVLELHPFLSLGCVGGDWPCFAVPQVDSHFGSFQTAPWGLSSPGCQSQITARKSSPCCRAPGQKSKIPGGTLISALVHPQLINTWPCLPTDPTWMSIADAKVGLTVLDREKSPRWTVLWMMSLWFTAATRRMGRPIFWARHPA